LKAQLHARIAAEEAEQRRRIDAEEEKAILSVQLEAVRGSKVASTATADSSDLDTYRVTTFSVTKQLMSAENCKMRDL
jgi:hypothetical protein